MSIPRPALDKARDAGDMFYFTGKPCIRGHIANRYVSNRKCFVCTNEYQKFQPELKKARAAAWRIKNIDRIRVNCAKNMKRRCARMQVRYRTDPAFALRARIRTQLRKLLNTNKNNRTTESLLGYTLEELRVHIEKQFLRGMSWENMNEWHLDHIIPLASFDIKTADDPELKRAWGLPNLRPLWAADNVLKSCHRVTLL